MYHRSAAIRDRQVKPNRGTRCCVFLSTMAFILLFTSMGQAQTVEELLERLGVKSVSAEDAYGPPLTTPEVDDLLVLGEDGLWAWREFKKVDCSIETKFLETRAHPSRCRHCAGTKKTLDLSRETPCMGCEDGKIYCHVCGGSGKLAIGSRMSSGRSVESCPGCAGNGSFKCTICKGKRRVVFAQMKGKEIPEARQEDLQARLDRLDDVRHEILGLIRRDAENAARGGRKYRSDTSYAPGHLSLMAKIQKYQGKMNGFVGGGNFSAEVGERFSNSIADQIQRERDILKIALVRYTRNAAIEAARVPEEAEEK